MSSVLERLNPEQRSAASHGDGPLLIIAGAGSGKTRTLTCRIAHLICERGVSPQQILAVTFTNKAAGELKERLRELLPGRRIEAMWVGTFHSLCARLLREHAERIGRDRNFAIFDEDDRAALLKRILEDLAVDVEKNPIKHIVYRMSDWKNDLLDPVQAAQRFGGGLIAPPDRIALAAYERYQERLRVNNALDFDDLIMEAVRLLRRSDDLRGQLNERFHHVLVDEYQDINLAQYELVKLLSERRRNLCVVGDDDQSIYGWRGAKVEIILRFDKDFPDAKVVKLERNYRSTQAVLDVSNALIANNSERRDKRLHTENPAGDAVTLHVTSNEQEEAWFVADQIQAGLREGRKLGEHVVLYRTNAMSRVFEQVFSSRQIRYRLIGGVRFYERKEVKDLIAYLRALCNPTDDVSLLRIVNVPTRGIGDKTMATVTEHARAENRSLFEALQHAGHDSELLGSGPRSKVKAFVETMERLRGKAEELDVAGLLTAVMKDTGYEAALLAEKSVEASSRLENLREMLSVAAEFTTPGREGLAEFLERVALVADTDNLAEGDDSVVLMTLHSAKGLEFPVVFLIGLEENIIPHFRSRESREGIEEERRLCYVGMTRARERLFLTHTTRRMLYGQTVANPPSRFVKEIPPELLVSTGRPTMPTATPSMVQREPARNLDSMTSILSRQKVAASGGRRLVQGTPAVPTAAAPAPYKAGQRVRHGVFGEGIVVSCTGGPSAEVQVAFPEHGVKKMAVEYAKLEVV